jgi:hypothetical protein
MVFRLRGVAQVASALASGARGPGFKSPHPEIFARKFPLAFALATSENQGEGED